LRTYLIAALAATTVAGGAATALAEDSGVSMSASVSPAKAGTLKDPRGATLRLNIVNGDSSRTMSKLIVLVPRTARVSTKGFKGCSEEKIVAGNCRKALGAGIAHALAGVSTFDPATQRQVRNPSPLSLYFKVTAHVMGKNRLGFHLQELRKDAQDRPTKTVNPSGLNLAAKARLRRASRPYGQKLVVTVPDQAKAYPTPTNFNGLVSLKTTLGGRSGKHRLVTTVGCVKHKYAFKANLKFIDNGITPATTLSAKDTSKCS
jgi:hypothetical protein